MQKKAEKRRYGPAPLPADQKRSERVSLYFTPAEYAEVVERHGDKKRLADVLRRFALTGRSGVPELNREAWVELSRAASALTQSVVLVRREENRDSIYWLKRRLAEFRAVLIGVKIPDQEVNE